MMNDLKLGYRVIKYGLNAEHHFILFGLLVLGAGFFDLMLPIGFGYFLYGLMGMSFIQLIHSLTLSTMVQTSPYKRKLQTTVPVLVAGVYMLIVNTVELFVQWMGRERYKNNNSVYVTIVIEPGEIETAIVVLSSVMVLIMILSALMLKHFWMGSVGMVIFYFALRYALELEQVSYWQIPMWAAVLISYLNVVIGCGIMYLIFATSYKKEYSKWTFYRELKSVK